MQTLVKTTITLPEDLYQMVKMKAVQEKTNVSALVRLGLLAQLRSEKRAAPKKSIASFFGSLPNKTYTAAAGTSILEDMFKDKHDTSA